MSNNNKNLGNLPNLTHEDLIAAAPRHKRFARKFIMAALGSIPWVGSFIVAAAEVVEEEADSRRDDIKLQWIQEHQRRLAELHSTLEGAQARFDSLGDEVKERIESEEYLALVRQSFRVWDHAETAEKRRYVANLIVNAAGTRLCSDDVVRLFASWIDLYHEAHFAVIREVHANPASTRYDIWTAIYGDTPREDSAEADLYKLLIRELTMGGVIRQVRDTNEAGQYLRKPSPRRRSRPPTTMESAFEDEKPYILTELGRQFVHYTMNESVTRIASETKGDSDGRV